MLVLNQQAIAGELRKLCRAEKQWHQDRIKCISGIQCNNGGQIRQMQVKAVPIMTTTMDRCTEFINKVRESRFIKVRDRQVNKFSRLLSKRDRDRGTNAQSIGNNGQSQAPSNNDNKWVINLPYSPLTHHAQESLLSKGPNCAIAPTPQLRLHYSYRNSLPEA